MMTAASVVNEIKRGGVHQKKVRTIAVGWNHNRSVDMAGGIEWPSSDSKPNLLTIVVEGRPQIQNARDSLTV